MKNIIDKILKTDELSPDEICTVLSADNTDHLFEKANQVKESKMGKTVKILGLIQICNICTENCLYCENRKDNPKQRYNLSPAEIINISKEFSKTGIKDVILQSGNTPTISTEDICKIIEKLKIYRINVTPALGERNEAEYRMLQAAGAEKIALNLITSSFTLFGELHPDMSLIGRIAALKFIKKHKMKSLTGILAGFPNQNRYSLAEDILTLKKLSVNAVEIIPFIPKSDTPLNIENAVRIDKILKVIALTRLIMPDTDIIISEDIREIDKNGIFKALQCGADTIIKNLTDCNCNKKDTDISYLKATNSQ